LNSRRVSAGIGGRKLFLCVLAILWAQGRADLWSKNYDGADGGHLGDICRVLTGYEIYDIPPPVKDQGEVFHVLTHALQLAIDSSENDIPTAQYYRSKLMDWRRKYRLKTIPDVSEFIAPRSSLAEHERYTHLGWHHEYDEQTQPRWLKSKQILLDTVGSIFYFSPLDLVSTRLFKKDKKDSFAAILYYVHILGDHEVNRVSNAHTRLPLKSMDEQRDDPGWKGWSNNPYWKPQGKSPGKPPATIVEELREHLSILFGDQIDSAAYQNLMNGLSRGFFGSVKDGAREILGLLSIYCPTLLRREPFAKGFYKKYLPGL
jgi:hypothetical protein